MRYIAHRGNIDGRNAGKENSPDYILQALNRGFDVEVDVWLYQETTKEEPAYYFGHDQPEYRVQIPAVFLENPLVWFHAKTIQTFYALMRNSVTAFYIDGDHACALTTRGHIWTTPGNVLTPRSIAVMPEYSPNWRTADLRQVYGICSDNLFAVDRELKLESTYKEMQNRVYW